MFWAGKLEKPSKQFKVEPRFIPLDKCYKDIT